MNVSVHDSDETWEAHVTNGADWVRAFFSGSGSAEEQCAALEGKLKRFGARVRFLVDPHGCDYQVSWGGGMDLAAEDKFCALWDRISKVGARYPQVIEGYDLYNEPSARDEDVLIISDRFVKVLGCASLSDCPCTVWAAKLKIRLSRPNLWYNVGRLKEVKSCSSGVRKS